ncbi:hypothetical protein AAVH_22729 [Aphelenchoides avenae]|nr:hypothetical protein AAVH_22729 [Aphelenchus avenae]
MDSQQQKTASDVDGRVASLLSTVSASQLLRIAAIIFRVLAERPTTTSHVDAPSAPRQAPPTPTGSHIRCRHTVKKKTVRKHGKDYACPICGKRVSALWATEHLNTHLMYSMRPHSCATCGKRYANKYCLQRHHRHAHSAI